MDGQHSPWNYGQVFNTSGESSESVLQFDASFSGSRGTSRTSEHDPGGMPSLDLSGRVISVTFTIPYKLRARKRRHDWVCILQFSLFTVLIAGFFIDV